MDQKEFNEIMSHIDYAEMMIYEKKALEFIDKKEYEDAVAYAMAMGTRLGWEAHKKKMEE